MHTPHTDIQFRDSACSVITFSVLEPGMLTEQLQTRGFPCVCGLSEYSLPGHWQLILTES